MPEPAMRQYHFPIFGECPRHGLFEAGDLDIRADGNISMFESSGPVTCATCGHWVAGAVARLILRDGLIEAIAIANLSSEHLVTVRRSLERVNALVMVDPEAAARELKKVSPTTARRVWNLLGSKAGIALIGAFTTIATAALPHILAADSSHDTSQPCLSPAVVEQLLDLVEPSLRPQLQGRPDPAPGADPGAPVERQRVSGPSTP